LLKFSRENNFEYPLQALARARRRECRMMDFILEAWVSGNIETAKAGWILGAGKPWQPGEKLKLLFAGYNGTRNMGSDVRVEEMLRQIRHILGAERVDFSVMSQNFDFSKGYFEGTRQVHLPDIFPPFLSERSSKASRRGGLRRLHVQEQIRQRADDHDDWFAGHCRRREQALGRLRRGSRPHGSAWWRKCARVTAGTRW
jgi:hypothetical protein